MEKYKKIYKRRGFLGGVNNLMVCPDHLLCIKSHGYSEDYKRFFFDDINWIKLVPVKLSLLIDVILGSGALVTFVLAATVSKDSSIFAWILAGVAFLVVVYIIINHLLGPSAKMIIQTYNQQDELVFKRYKKAAKVLKVFKAYVNDAQGAISNAELFERIKADEDATGNVKVI